MTDIRRFAEHSVDLSILPPEPLVLDVGCRGFDFAAAIREVRPHSRIVCLDPTPEVACDARRNLYNVFFSLALSHEPGYVRQALYCWGDGVGNFIAHAARTPKWFFETAEAHGFRAVEVESVSIGALMSSLQVQHWDLVKLDCEASEFAILEHWPGPIATQISVEFHDYMHRDRYDAAYFRKLFTEHLPWYAAVQHEDFPACDNAMGHWDSLLALKAQHRKAER